MTETTVFDTHVHLVDDPGWVTGERLRPLQRRFTAADFSAATAGTAVAGFVAVPAVPTVEETWRLLRLAAGHPSLARVVGWVDLTAPDVVETISDLQSGPGGDRLRGIRHPVRREPELEWLTRVDVRRGLHALAERGLLFELLVLPGQIPSAAAVAKEFPHLSLVLDHGATPSLEDGPFDGWEEDIRALAAHRNVTCKISGPLVHVDPRTTPDENIARCVEVLADAFGSDRLMFGSNYPFCLLTGTYSDAASRAEALLDSLTELERDQIFARTARSVYGRHV
ncbi:amidohydrolase family protein [Phytoactinopolyspora endophytica]|uniref:amidohydrolase family protein n=1 Tax=Phytoactinopolyspora endophytica TaxID=1642495 RepID=UPI00101DB2D7|nr:amidohydrolase family protein [Phytoactinopolyspora endophytica]